MSEVQEQEHVQVQAESTEEQVGGSAGTTEDGTAAESATAEAGEQQAQEQGTEEPPKKAGGFQKRIAKLAAQRDQAAAEAEYWRARVLSTKPDADATASAEKPKPKPDDFTIGDGQYDVAAYTEALTDWKTAEAIKSFKAEQEKARQQQSEQERQTELQKSYAEQIGKAQEKYHDFDDVAFNPALPITKPMAEALAESPLGAEIAYFLGKNPEEAGRISRLGPLGAARELGRIEARLAQPESSAVTEKPKPRVTQAPPPITPVRKTASADDGELRDDLDPAEWGRRFDKKMAKSYG